VDSWALSRRRLLNRRITGMHSLQHLDLRFRGQSDIRPNQAVNYSGITGLEVNGGPPNSTASASATIQLRSCYGPLGAATKLAGHPRVTHSSSLASGSAMGQGSIIQLLRLNARIGWCQHRSDVFGKSPPLASKSATCFDRNEVTRLSNKRGNGVQTAAWQKAGIVANRYNTRRHSGCA
jgi:hypothetical protein